MRNIFRLALALGLAAVVSAARAAPVCAPAGSDKAVEAVVQAWFEAGRHDDLAAIAGLQGKGFYAFDGGERFDGLRLAETLKTMHASGATIVWNLHDMEVHAGCDQAWASWINTGSASMGGKTQQVVWLESAVLRWSDGRWRMVFLHSARVPPKAS
ncbi:MAG: nuclear transport factor 2 family protein [Proteobacteria bacterium]|nr:nuclear transport factor 2 family protein [Pseudomonadota bacterium]